MSYTKFNIAHGLRRVRSKTALLLAAVGIAVGSGGGLALSLLGTAHADIPTWSLNGTYTFDFESNGSHYVHDATISGQNNSGAFTISGGYPAGSAYSYAWKGTGTVTGNTVKITADYTAGAVNTHMTMAGAIATNGALSGTWNDNYNGTTRNGTWTAATGLAMHIPTQVVVTPNNTHGWSTADTRTGGAVTYLNDSTAPGTPHTGALQLTTDSSTAAKAQYMHSTKTPLSSISELSYATKQHAASIPDGAPSYQLAVCLLGTSAPTNDNPSGCNGYTTLVYEPYQNNGTVTANTWQTWNVAAGQFWSSRTVSSGDCTTTAGAGGQPFYGLSDLSTACPDAVAVGFGVNVGSNNPSYNVEADQVNFNGTAFNFEPSMAHTDNKEQCKKDGWKTLEDAHQHIFRNQGDCVSFFASNGHPRH